jgi:hypothetical protein
MAHLKPKIKKLCIVCTYVDMDELLAVTMEVEKVVGEIRETPYEPLKDERKEEMHEGETSTEN